MTDEYDLKPLEPPPGKEPPPAPPDSAPLDFAPDPKMQSAAPDGPVHTQPPAFIPPTVIVEGPDPEPPEPGATSPEDVEKHKGVCIVGYLPPLFIVPLLISPASRYARYHANQGLLLFILCLAIILGVANLEMLRITLFPLLTAFGMGVLSWMGACIVHVGSVFLVVFMIAMSIFGIVHAANGESKPLPFIGRFQLLRP